MMTKTSTIIGIVLAALLAGSALAEDKPAAPTPAPEVIYFAWRPSGAPAASYEMPEPEDQHRIVLFPGVEPGETAYPVVAGFHGVYKKKKSPREYPFLEIVPEVVGQMIRDGQARPLVLVLPVYRHKVLSWPGFDMVRFRAKVESVLAERGIAIEKDWVLFGHSGAAGCGGDGGLNQAWRVAPKVVGFVDTCLGKGWQKAVRELRKRQLPAVNLHSVETAAFRPRHRPEYDHTFDFGRAYKPLGLAPVDCPSSTPGPLRDQAYRCAATPDGVIRSFVIDTGEGAPAHRAAVAVGVRYLVKEYVGK